MNDRWIPHFYGMLKKMEHLGNLGASRQITFFSDGDGDFRPKFKYIIENLTDTVPIPAEPEVKCNGTIMFDAG